MKEKTSRATASLQAMSFVIPAYNAGSLLSGCLEAIAEAARLANARDWEIIVVDDGSTDDTASIAKRYATDLPIKVVSQPNGGRFLARKAGIEAAAYSTITLVDTKVLLDPGSLQFLASQAGTNPERLVWCCHVRSDSDHNLVAAFNEASVMMTWGRYLRNPRLVGFGIDEFDYYPKGTTCLSAPRDLLLEACQQFKPSTDLKHASDDTRLLRYIAAQTNIWLTPDFACFYRARSSAAQFIPWVFNRGVLFIDSYLHPGTRFYWIVLAALVAPLPFLGIAWALPWVLCAPVIVWLCAIAYLRLRLPGRYWFSVVCLSWPYFLLFYAGLYKGAWLKYKPRST